MCFGGGSDNSAARAAEEEAKRQKRLTQGTTAIDEALSGFGDEYFTGLSNAYSANATPQLESDYKDAQKELIFALSRSGLLSSKTAADRQAALDTEYAQYQKDIANAASAYASDAKSNLETTRSNLISQLYATEDPTTAASAAATQAGLLNATPTFDAVGDFVFNTAEELKNYSNQATGGSGYSYYTKPNLYSSSGSSTTTKY